MVNLWERNFLLDTVLELPTLHSSFECSSNRVRHARLTVRRVVLLFEPIQNRVWFESRIVFKSFVDFAPKLLERIWASAVRALGPFHLAWQQACIAILPDRLFTHLQPPCNTRHRLILVEQQEQLARSNVRDHDQPPLQWGLQSKLPSCRHIGNRDA